MLVVAYKINEQLVSNVEKDESCCSQAILMGAFLIITGFNIWWIVEQFQKFSCAGNITIMTITIIGSVLMYALVLVRAREDASLLTSSIAVSYVLYLQWSALSSDDNPACNSQFDDAINASW